MRTHTLKNAPGYELTYSIVAPGKEQTFEQEGLDPTIEITDIHLLGSRLCGVKFCELLAANEYEWSGEILTAIKQEKNK